MKLHAEIAQTDRAPASSRDVLDLSVPQDGLGPLYVPEDGALQASLRTASTGEIARWH